MPDWNLDIDWEGKTQKKTASKRWNLNVDWGKEPDTTFDTSKLEPQTFAGGRKDVTYVKGTGVSEQPQREIYRSPVLETLQAPVKAIGQGLKEIGEGKVAEGTIDILSGTLKGAMLPITAPLTEADELLRQSGDIGSAIAEAGAKIMNIPFDAVNNLSDIAEKGLNLIGTSGKEIDKSLGISEGVSQKGSDLTREVAGLLTMVYGAKYTKAVINRYQENIPKMLLENAQRKIEANPELKAQFEEMAKPKPIDIPKVAEKTVTGEPLTPQETVIAKEMPREVELAKQEVQNAIEKGKIEQSNIEQYKGTPEIGQKTTETGGGNRPIEGGEVKKIENEYVAFNSTKDRIVGRIQISDNKTNNFRDIVDSSVPQDLRNKGIGKSLYKEVGELTLQDGKILRSLQRSPEAKNVWESLIKEGVAKKENIDGNDIYTYIGKIQKEIKTTPEIIQEASKEVGERPITVAQKAIKIDEKIYDAPSQTGHKASWDKAKADIGEVELQKAFDEGRISVMTESGEWQKLGEIKGDTPTKVATDINKILVDKGFAELPESSLSTYKGKNVAQLKERVAETMSDYQSAKEMLSGKKPIPIDVDPQVLFETVKTKATLEGDSATLRDLAFSPIGTARSEAASTLSVAGHAMEVKVGDPVRAMQDIVKAREKSWGRTNLTTKAKELETRVKDLESKLSLKEEELQKIDSEKAYKTLKRQVDYQTRKENRSYTKETLKEERSVLYTDLYKEISNLNAGVPLSGKAIKILGELTKSYAKEGLLNAEAVVDAIYVELKNQIDKRTIRDAISKYGIPSKQTRTDLTKAVGDLRQQMTVISKIEDIEAGKQPIRKEVAKGQPSENLQTLRAKLKSKLDEYGITEQENLTKSKQQIIKKIAEYNQKINSGDYAKPEKITPTDAEKTSLQKQLEDVRGQWNYVQKSLGDILSPEEAKYITDLSKQIADAKEKMNSVPRRENLGKATPEEMEYGRARVAFAEYVDGLKEGAKKMTFEEFKSKPIKTVGEALKHIPGITKSAKATLDLSGLFNQGMPVLMTNPVIWQRNALKSFRDIAHTFGGKNVLAEVSADIISRPNYELYKKDGLAVGVVEEAFPDSRLLERIPLLGKVHKAADAAFTAFAHRNRADLYDYYTDLAKKSGIEETTGLGIGKLANSLTGRGYLGGLEKSATTINNVFFSPRLVKSRFDILTAHTLSKDISPFVRKQAALNLLKIVGATAGIMATVKALGGNVELDPRSSDFGKIKVGDTRFNFTGGMNSLVTLGSKIITSSTKNAKGEVKDLNTGKFGSQTSWEVFENFMEGKLSPVAGVLRDVMKGQTFSGEKPTVGGELKNLIVPLPITNYEELASNPNSAPIIAAMLADALGIFTNTYSDDPDLRKVKNTLLRDDKLKGEAKMNFYKSLNKSLNKGIITKEQYKDYRTEFEEIQKTRSTK